MRGKAEKRYAEGSLRDAEFAPDGVPGVSGAGRLPSSKEEWEPALSDLDVDRLLGGEEGPGLGRPEPARDDREDRCEPS